MAHIDERDTLSRPGVSRLEWTALVMCCAVGLTLRCARLDRATVEHFDEGVYASNIWFSREQGFAFPGRHLYAPPLVPAMIEWSIMALRPTGAGCLLPGLLFGCATILLTWHVARDWFGPRAGLAAVALVSLSDFHCVYTRTVLTDTPLAFCLLLAVYLTERALRSGSTPGLLAAGTATGLACWTKYNGWLPLAIGLSGAVAWFIVHRPTNPGLARLVARWLGIAVVAFAVWCPVWFGLQDVGGYHSVAENHRGYLVGWSGWPGAAVRQFANHRALDGWPSALSLLVAPLLAGPFLARSDPRFTWNAREDAGMGRAWALPLAGGLVLVACSLFSVSSLVLGAASLCGIAANLRRPVASQHVHQRRDVSLPCWLIAAWLIGLTLATPFYRPYPRLTLPWLIAAWLGTSAMLGWWAEMIYGRLQTTRNVGAVVSRSFAVGFLSIAVLSVALAVGASLQRVRNPVVHAWDDRTGMETAAAEIKTACQRRTSFRAHQRDPAESLVYVYGEPALFFHLRAMGVPAAPIADLSFAGPNRTRSNIATFLVTGPHAARSPVFREEWRKLHVVFDPVDTFDYAPSEIVKLNHMAGQAPGAGAAHPSETIRLYALKQIPRSDR